MARLLSFRRKTVSTIPRYVKVYKCYKLGSNDQVFLSSPGVSRGKEGGEGPLATACVPSGELSRAIDQTAQAARVRLPYYHRVFSFINLL